MASWPSRTCAPASGCSAWTASRAGTARTTACRTSPASRTGTAGRREEGQDEGQLTACARCFSSSSSRGRRRRSVRHHPAQHADGAHRGRLGAPGVRGVAVRRGRHRRWSLASRRTGHGERDCPSRRRSAATRAYVAWEVSTDLAAWKRLGVVTQRHEHRRPSRSRTSSCSSSRRSRCRSPRRTPARRSCTASRRVRGSSRSCRIRSFAGSRNELATDDRVRRPARCRAPVAGGARRRRSPPPKGRRTPPPRPTPRIERRTRRRALARIRGLATDHAAHDMPIPMPAGMPMLPGLIGLRPRSTPFLPGAGVDPRSLPLVKPTATRRVKDGDTLDLTAGLVRRTVRGRTFVMYAFNGQVPGPAASARIAGRDDHRALPQSDRPAEHRALARPAAGESIRRRARPDAGRGRAGRELHVSRALPRCRRLLVPPARARGHRSSRWGCTAT